MVQIVNQIKGIAVAVLRVAIQRHGKDSLAAGRTGDDRRRRIDRIGQRHAIGRKAHGRQVTGNRRVLEQKRILRRRTIRTEVNRDRPRNGGILALIGTVDRIAVSGVQVVLVDDTAAFGLRTLIRREIDFGHAVADHDSEFRRILVAVAVFQRISELVADVGTTDIHNIRIRRVGPGSVRVDGQFTMFGIDRGPGISRLLVAVFVRIGEGNDLSPFTVGTDRIVVDQQIAGNGAAGRLTRLLDAVVAVILCLRDIVDDIDGDRTAGGRTVAVRDSDGEGNVFNQVFRCRRRMIQIVQKVERPAIAVLGIARQRHGEDGIGTGGTGDRLTVRRHRISQRNAIGREAHVGERRGHGEFDSVNPVLTRIDRQRTGNRTGPGPVGTDLAVALCGGQVVFIDKGTANAQVRVARRRRVDRNRRRIVGHLDRLFGRSRVAVAVDNRIGEIVHQRPISGLR